MISIIPAVEEQTKKMYMFLEYTVVWSVRLVRYIGVNKNET